jgi:hypothetical protein
MPNYQVNKTFQEINEKIKKGRAVVVTAEEIIDLVRQKGEAAAARQVDVVTTGTFSAMCSSGAFLEFRALQAPHQGLPGMAQQCAGLRRGGRGGCLSRGHRTHGG